MEALPTGCSARVRVPATSANLGPGFDCMGLALDWYDELAVEVLDGPDEFALTGEGADQVPRDGSHLVLRTLRDGLVGLGCLADGLRLTAHATIPHSRGLGSSAAAIVAGLGLAWALARPGAEVDLDWVCHEATALEGHPDNVVPATLGGVVLAWGDRPDVARLVPTDGLSTRVWVPAFEVPTSGARGVLPEQVPFRDAAAQATSAALLVHALTRDPAVLLRATEDRLHQPYRASLMPQSAELMSRLRAVGVAATVSGAGPTVLALGTEEQLAAADGVEAAGFACHALGLGEGLLLLR